MLIIFDGIDGVGKTTQLELVREELAKEGHQVEVSRNLGGTPIGEALREVMKSTTPRPETANVYISAAIQEALIEAMAAKPADTVVLMDRGPLSLAAYEQYGSQLSAELVWPHVLDGMERLKPDLYVIYDADVKASLERARRQSAKADYFESKSQAYFEKVAAGYKQSAAKFPNKVVVLNGDGTIEDIHRRTMGVVRQSFQNANA